MIQSSLDISFFFSIAQNQNAAVVHKLCLNIRLKRWAKIAK